MATSIKCSNAPAPRPKDVLYEAIKKEFIETAAKAVKNNIPHLPVATKPHKNRRLLLLLERIPQTDFAL